jgi:hypothetical protein
MGCRIPIGISSNGSSVTRPVNSTAGSKPTYGKDGKDVGDCLDGKFGGVGMEIRLVALPIEVEVTRIENKAHSQREEHLYKSASNHDGHGGDEGDELEEG